LLHVIPKEINQIISHLVTFSDSHMINIDWYQEDLKRVRYPHNFIHQYEKIYKNINRLLKLKKRELMKKYVFLMLKYFDVNGKMA